MDTKICRTCKETKVIVEFHKSKNSKDGLQSSCKVCGKNYKQEHRNLDHERDYQRVYQANYVKQHPNAHNARVKKWRDEHPESKQAHTRIYEAIKTGKIVRPITCEFCGRTDIKLHAHHHNGYEHPLDVQWLCPKCHKQTENARNFN